MPESVIAERHGPVLLLTFNRPDRLNAWNDEIEDCYFDHLEGAEADPGVRAVVVTGAGRGFCAGADFDALQATDGPEAEVLTRRRPRCYPMTLRKPLIAALNGAAAGLGLVEALYCDVRFAVPKAKITTAFVQRGLIAEYGSAWLLPRLIGTSRALDLLLSGRIIRAVEALPMGLVDRICEPESLVEEALAYATELANYSSPASMSIIKRQVFEDLDRPFESAFEDAEVKIRESFERPDVKEGVESYLEQRTPQFPPLPPVSPRSGIN
jgi:enoyl-CoA hydratase/carnithine racemase